MLQQHLANDTFNTNFHRLNIMVFIKNFLWIILQFCIILHKLIKDLVTVAQVFNKSCQLFPNHIQFMKFDAYRLLYVALGQLANLYRIILCFQVPLPQFNVQKK